MLAKRVYELAYQSGKCYQNGMRIIASTTLLEYAEKFPRTLNSARAWISTTRAARWQSSADVLKDFPSASNINSERVRFKLDGNHHRMIVTISYEKELVYIKFIGTHAEYDQIDAATVKIF